MKKALLEYLICPYCQKKFKVAAFLTEHHEIVQGKLLCSCREYPIINGVPRILPDELRPTMINHHPRFFKNFKVQGYENDQSSLSNNNQRRLDREKIITTTRFSYEWKKFAQLHQEYEQQFLDWVDLPKTFFKNKIILDAGCGTGRHLDCVSRYGAKVAIGIDLGESIEVANRHHRQKNNVHVVQADIYHLPFPKQSFDYAYSIGVLHHLPQPESGFRAILEKIKNKGGISIWVYGREGNGLLKLMDPIRKHFISKLPLKVVDALSLLIITPLYPIFKLYKVINESRLKPLSKILPQNDFFYYLSKLNFRICHCILFDQLLAPTAYYYKASEIMAWFKQAGIGTYKITARNKNSWRGYGEIVK